jgi:tRNA(His) guanylyltransferase
MAQTLQHRQLAYENSYRQNIISRIPVIIKIDGRSFTRVTHNTSKPFCQRTMALLNHTMVALAKQIDGVIFGYQYSDKIILVLRNDRSPDETPWFGNCTQKMSTSAASMATYEFMTQMWGMDNPPDLDGAITFSAHAFGVPSIKEVINYLLYRQFRCIQSAVDEAVRSVLWSRYGSETHSILEDKDINDRKQILDEAGFEFDSLPSAFRHGSATYLAPAFFSTTHGQITRHKWISDFNVPLFNDSKEWLNTIITTGSDIFRPERDYDDTLKRSH